MVGAYYTLRDQVCDINARFSENVVIPAKFLINIFANHP